MALWKEAAVAASQLSLSWHKARPQLVTKIDAAHWPLPTAIILNRAEFMSRPRPLEASLEKPFDLNSLPSFQLISCLSPFLVQQNQTYPYTFPKIVSSQQPSGAQSCTRCHLPPQHTFPSKLNKMT